MTQADAGGHPDVMVSGKLIGAVENCYRPPTLRLSKGLDKAFGLVQFYEGIYASIKRESGIPSDFWEYTEQETLASFIKIYENFLITGLLQTKEYAREIVRAGLRAGDPARQSGQRARSTLRSDRIRRTADRGLGETDPHGLGGHAMMFDLSSTQWRKSSRSGSSGDQCVEVADLDTAIGVRDSKDPGGPKLTFTPGEWKTFTTHAKAGRHDLT